MKLHDLPEFKRMVKKKWQVSLLLTFLMLIIYFGFILLIAFDKPFLAKPIGKNLTIGLPIGIGILIFAWLLTGVYTWWANKYYDKQVDELKKKMS
jgi:uncharacterized membrane protein (DUF485 family)